MVIRSFLFDFFSNPTAAEVALTPDEFFYIILYALWGHILYEQEVQRMSHSQEHRTESLVKRLNRIEGQVAGIKKMILEEKEYADVIIQLNSTRSAIQKISHILLEAQTEHSLMHVSEGADLDEEMKKLQKVIAQYNKMN